MDQNLRLETSARPTHIPRSLIKQPGSSVKQFSNYPKPGVRAPQESRSRSVCENAKRTHRGSIVESTFCYASISWPFVAHNCTSMRRGLFLSWEHWPRPEYDASVRSSALSRVSLCCLRISLRGRARVCIWRTNRVNYWYLEGVSRGVTRRRGRCETTCTPSSPPPTIDHPLILVSISIAPLPVVSTARIFTDI